MSLITIPKKSGSETHTQDINYLSEIAFLRLQSAAFRWYEEEMMDNLSTLDATIEANMHNEAYLHQVVPTEILLYMQEIIKVVMRRGRG